MSEHKTSTPPIFNIGELIRYMVKHGIKIRYILSVCSHHPILQEKVICIKLEIRKLTRAHTPQIQRYEKRAKTARCVTAKWDFSVADTCAEEHLSLAYYYYLPTDSSDNNVCALRQTDTLAGLCAMQW